MKLSREEAIENHRKMWQWIAEETLKREKIVCKEEYLEEYFPNEVICCDCFCCEYGRQQINLGYDMRYGCKFCPLDWDSSTTVMCCDRFTDDDDLGWFALWEKITKVLNWQQASELAKIIAELPERKEVE